MAASAQAAYEKEQEVLRKKHEGKDIHIDVPREPEVKPEVYRDVEPLLFRGFLTLPADINGARFVFKSLNHHELELLRMSGDFGASSYKFWETFLAYGVFMVEGHNVLLDREKWLDHIAKTFRDMDMKPKQHVIRYLSELNRRANNAVTLTECYFTESYSRYRWAQLKGLDLCSSSVTGVPGSEQLGYNWGQLMWRALNYFEDRNEEAEREWDNAKFIGSCFAGKGIQKIYQQDTDRRQKDKQDRFSRKDRLLRQVLLGEKILEANKQLQGAILTVPHTVEDLAGQLEKDLKGEKDFHDSVVEAHEKRIRDNLAARQNQVRELVKKHDQDFGDHRVVGRTDFHGLSAAEVQERVLRRKQLEAQHAARQMVHPANDPKSAQFLDKWGMNESGVAFSVEETSQDPTHALPVPAPRQGGTPFRRK